MASWSSTWKASTLEKCLGQRPCLTVNCLKAEFRMTRYRGTTEGDVYWAWQLKASGNCVAIRNKTVSSFHLFKNASRAMVLSLWVLTSSGVTYPISLSEVYIPIHNRCFFCCYWRVSVVLAKGAQWFIYARQVFDYWATLLGLRAMAFTLPDPAIF